MVKCLSALTWMMGLLMAPHALALMGNLAGAHQWKFFILLVIVAGIYWINAHSINRLRLPTIPSAKEAQRSVLTLIQLISRWVTAMALSTVLLVTAGFSFNETFLQWFPNFAFAFFLLGVILTVQLLGPNAARRFQYALVTVVLVGLVTLITMGLWGSSVPTVENVPKRSAIPIYEIFTMLLLFVGFDLVSNHGSHRSVASKRSMAIGLSVVVLVWGLWGWISLIYVPAAKLSESFIPHIIAARNVGANLGRIIMGAVIIAGSAAAVNALLTSLAQTTPPAVFHWWRGRSKRLDWINRPASWSVLSAAVIGSMMAGGVAGSDEIDLYVRAGLILWLFYYGIIHLTVLMELYRKSAPVKGHEWLMPALGAPVMGIGAGALVLLDPHSVFIMKILLSVSIAGLLLWIPIFMRKRHDAVARSLPYKTQT